MENNNGIGLDMTHAVSHDIRIVAETVRDNPKEAMSADAGGVFLRLCGWSERVRRMEEDLAEKDAAIAKLRKCLKEAIDYNCALCESKGKACEVEGFCSEHRWRKALEGGDR